MACGRLAQTQGFVVIQLSGCCGLRVIAVCFGGSGRIGLTRILEYVSLLRAAKVGLVVCR